MTMFTSKNLVAIALVAVVCLLVVFYGCSRKVIGPEPVEPQPPAAEGDDTSLIRMDDPNYLAALDERVEARKVLTRQRQRLVDQMNAKVAAAKERLATEDEAAIKAELEKDPEWNSLYKRVEDMNTALDDERKRVEAVVRNRILADMQRESGEK